MPQDIPLEVREEGPGKFPQPTVGELPPGAAKWPVPHYESKVGLINQVGRSYRWTHDEATKHNRENAVRMLNDLLVRNALVSRITPTAQLSWFIKPKDETDPKQVEAAHRVQLAILDTHRLQDLFSNLLYATWYGRQGSALIFEWNFNRGYKGLRIRNHIPINGDSLVARWSGDWGQLVNATYPGDKEFGDGRGWAHYYTPEEREAIVVHTHLPEDCDFYDYELAGQVRGNSLRGHVYWWWFLRSNLLALIEDYAERFAWGIQVATYDETNPEGKRTMQTAVANYSRDRVLYLPVNKQDNTTPYSYKIEEVGTANPAFLLELVEDFGSLITQYIIGATVDQNTQVAIGGDAVGVMEERLGSVVKYDAIRLAETLSVELVPTFYRYMVGPEVPPGDFIFSVEHPNAGEILGYATSIKNLGGEIDLNYCNQVAGLPAPQPGAAVATNIQPMSNVAAQTTVPQGMPVVGAPGPQQQQSQQVVQQPQPQQQVQPQQ